MTRINLLRSVPSARAKSFRFFAAILLASAIVVTAGSANDDLERAKAVSERMKARQAQLDQILKDQKAGERNDGLLEPMSDLTPEISKLIAEENRDREAIFSGIARASVTPISEIKKRRADSLRDRLLPGVYRMVPTEDGQWEWSVGQEERRMPPRLLTRPGASLRSVPGGDVSVSGISNFTMYEVIDQAESASKDLWYQVSERGEAPLGWIREAEALEWHQSLVMQYTQQTNRNRVLYFFDKEELRILAQMPADDRAKETSRLVETAQKGGDPGRSVIALEPVFDQRTQEIPVVIPILDHEVLTIDDVRETRLLHLAAATRSEPEKETLKIRPPLIDIVFAMDTTSSMGPYLEETKLAVAEFAAGVGGSDPTIRFGVVAYRDSDPRFQNKMEYTVKNFTPSLVNASELVEVLDQIKALPADPGDRIPEDVFSGIAEASRSSWRGDKPGDELRIIILVGDASGNEPYNSTGARNLANESALGQENLRDILNQGGISLQSIHIKAPSYKSDHAKAEADFSVVSRNPGDSIASRYMSVDYQPQSFKANIKAPFIVMENFLTRDKSDFEKNSKQADRAVEQGLAQPSVEQMFGGLLANAYVQWVTGQNRVPLDRDIKGWVIPNDLADSAHQSMEVRLMLKRPELENLKRRLDGVLQAANDNSQAGGDFFDRIQLIPGNTIRNPAANEFSAAFDVPTFITNLPYRSRMLGMKRGDWEAMSEGNKIQYINDWRNMSTYYGGLLQGLAPWKKLSPEGDDFVMSPLTMLP